MPSLRQVWEHPSLDWTLCSISHVLGTLLDAGATGIGKQASTPIQGRCRRKVFLVHGEGPRAGGEGGEFNEEHLVGGTPVSLARWWILVGDPLTLVPSLDTQGRTGTRALAWALVTPMFGQIPDCVSSTVSSICRPTGP